MDLTCPELAKIDVTSDYGSNDSSCSSQQEEGYAGICSLPDSVGKREETTCLRGGVTKKNGKIWGKFPIRLDPPLPSDQIQKSLKLRTYRRQPTPSDRHLKRRIYIEKAI